LYAEGQSVDQLNFIHFWPSFPVPFGVSESTGSQLESLHYSGEFGAALKRLNLSSPSKLFNLLSAAPMAR
jgi:hypothetical protein